MVDCNLLRQIQNFSIKQNTPPNALPNCTDIQCALRNISIPFWSSLPASYRARYPDFFTKSCKGLPNCCRGCGSSSSSGNCGCGDNSTSIGS